MRVKVEVTANGSGMTGVYEGESVLFVQSSEKINGSYVQAPALIVLLDTGEFKVQPLIIEGGHVKVFDVNKLKSLDNVDNEFREDVELIDEDLIPTYKTPTNKSVKASRILKILDTDNSQNRVVLELECGAKVNVCINLLKARILEFGIVGLVGAYCVIGEGNSITLMAKGEFEDNYI
ncbi:MAG: hypothetical protein WC733_00060 [Methylophilus sp.]